MRYYKKFMLLILASLIWSSLLFAQIDSYNHDERILDIKAEFPLGQSNATNLVRLGNAFVDATQQTVFKQPNKAVAIISRNGEEPPEIVFTDTPIEWARIHQDTTLPSLQDSIPNLVSTIDGYEVLREASLLLDDRLIEVFSTGVRYGSYVVCTDVTTGEKLWEQAYNWSTGVENIEIDLSIYERSDGNIELSGMRMLFNNIPNMFPYGTAHRKVLNPETGQLITRYFTPWNSEGGESGIVCTNSNGQLGRTFPIVEDELYLNSCLYSFILEGAFIQMNLALDEQGVFLDTIDKIPNPMPFPNDGSIQLHKYLDAFKLPNGKFVVGSASIENPLDSTELVSELLFLDEQGALDYRVDISSLISYDVGFSLKIEGEYIIVTGDYYDKFGGDPSTARSIAIFDLEGNVLFSKTAFKTLDGEPVRFRPQMTALGEDRFLIVGGNYDECLRYFLLDETGDISLLRTICQPDPDWRLRIEDVAVASNGTVITGASWNKGSADLPEAIFRVIFSIKAEELGLQLPSSLTETESAQHLRLYPNPAREAVVVDFERPAAGTARIISMSGQPMRTLQTDATLQLRISTAGLPPGTYVLQFESESSTWREVFVVSP